MVKNYEFRTDFDKQERKVENEQSKISFSEKLVLDPSRYKIGSDETTFFSTDNFSVLVNPENQAVPGILKVIPKQAKLGNWDNWQKTDWIELLHIVRLCELSLIQAFDRRDPMLLPSQDEKLINCLGKQRPIGKTSATYFDIVPRYNKKISLSYLSEGMSVTNNFTDELYGKPFDFRNVLKPSPALYQFIVSTLRGTLKSTNFKLWCLDDKFQKSNNCISCKHLSENPGKTGIAEMLGFRLNLDPRSQEERGRAFCATGSHGHVPALRYWKDAWIQDLAEIFSAYRSTVNNVYPSEQGREFDWLCLMNLIEKSSGPHTHIHFIPRTPGGKNYGNDFSMNPGTYIPISESQKTLIVEKFQEKFIDNLLKEGLKIDWPLIPHQLVANLGFEAPVDVQEGDVKAVSEDVQSLVEKAIKADHLDLTNSQFNDKQYNALLKALKKNGGVTKFTQNNYKFSGRKFRLLNEYIANNDKLKVLELENCSIDTFYVGKLYQTLSSEYSITKLTILNLKNNQLEHMAANMMLAFAQLENINLYIDKIETRLAVVPDTVQGKMPSPPLAPAVGTFEGIELSPSPKVGVFSQPKEITEEINTVSSQPIILDPLLYNLFLQHHSEKTNASLKGDDLDKKRKSEKNSHFVEFDDKQKFELSLQEANRLYFANMNKQATKLYEFIIYGKLEDGSFSLIYERLAVLYAIQNKLELAEKFFELSIKYCFSFNSHLNYAIFLYKKKNYKKCIDIISQINCSEQDEFVFTESMLTLFEPSFKMIFFGTESANKLYKILVIPLIWHLFIMCNELEENYHVVDKLVQKYKVLIKTKYLDLISVRLLVQTLSDLYDSDTEPVQDIRDELYKEKVTQEMLQNCIETENQEAIVPLLGAYAETCIKKRRYDDAAKLINGALALTRDPIYVNALKKKYDNIEKFKKIIFEQCQKVEYAFLTKELGINSELAKKFIHTGIKNKQNIINLRKKIREEIVAFNSNLNNEVIEKLMCKITKVFREIIAIMIKDCIALMPTKPPCLYAFVSTGSLAREEMTPYSDLEYFILIDKDTKECREYFIRVSNILQLEIINLGETDLVKELKLLPRNMKSPIKIGFSLDVHKNPTDEDNELIGTPEKLSVYQSKNGFVHKPSNHLSMSLITCDVIYGEGSEELIKSYTEKMRSHLQEKSENSSLSIAKARAIEMLRTDGIRFAPRLSLEDMGSLLNIKKDFYRLPNIIVDSLALYYNLSANSTWERIKELSGVLENNQAHQHFILILRQAISMAAYIRVTVGLEYGYSVDEHDFFSAKKAKSVSIGTIDPMILGKVRRAYEILIYLFQEMKAIYLYNSINLRVPNSSVEFPGNKSRLNGLIEMRLLNYNISKKYFLEAFNLCKNAFLVQDNKIEGDLRLQLISDCLYLSKINQVLFCKKEAIENLNFILDNLNSDSSSNSLRARLLVELAELYLQDNRMDVKEIINKYLLEAFKIYRALALQQSIMVQEEARIQEAIIYNLLGKAYCISDFGKLARWCYERALQIYLNLENDYKNRLKIATDSLFVAEVYYNFAELYYTIFDNLDLALWYLDKSLNTNNNGARHYHPLTLKIEILRMAILSKQGKQNELEYYEKNLQLARKLADGIAEIKILIYMGDSCVYPIDSIIFIGAENRELNIDEKERDITKYYYDALNVYQINKIQAEDLHALIYKKLSEAYFSFYEGTKNGNYLNKSRDYHIASARLFKGYKKQDFNYGFSLLSYYKRYYKEINVDKVAAFVQKMYGLLSRNREKSEMQKIEDFFHYKRSREIFNGCLMLLELCKEVLCIDNRMIFFMDKISLELDYWRNFIGDAQYKLLYILKEHPHSYLQDEQAAIKASLEHVRKQEKIGPKKIVNWQLRDVEGKGNCFYLAVIDQFKLMKHSFIAQVPRGTEPHNSLRLCIQGDKFIDRDWADYEEIMKLCSNFDLVVAIVDTRAPKLGFRYYYINNQGIRMDTNKWQDLPNKPIVRLAFAGNHFLSVRKYITFDLLERVIDLYVSNTPKVKHGNFNGMFPRPLRDIVAEVLKIKFQGSDTKQGLDNIINIALQMGQRHPILIVARRLQAFLRDLARTENQNQVAVFSSIHNAEKNYLPSYDSMNANASKNERSVAVILNSCESLFSDARQNS